MPFVITGKIEGVEKALAALQGVSAKVRKKALKKGIDAATKLLLWTARAKVPTNTGQLKKSLGRRTKVYRNTGIVVGIVGPRTGFKIAVGTYQRGNNAGKPIMMDPVRYAHLVELGTSRSPAKPFLAPAFEAEKANIAKGMADAVASAIAGGKP